MNQSKAHFINQCTLPSLTSCLFVCLLFSLLSMLVSALVIYGDYKKKSFVREFVYFMFYLKPQQSDSSYLVYFLRFKLIKQYPILYFATSIQLHPRRSLPILPVGFGCQVHLLRFGHILNRFIKSDSFSVESTTRSGLT